MFSSPVLFSLPVVRVAASAATLSAFVLLLGAAPAAHAQTTTFNTPGQFNFVVPVGVTSLSVIVNGAGGLRGTDGGNGGNGGTLTARLSNIGAGTTLTLFVGGNYASPANGSGGINAGGEFSAIAFGAGQTRPSLVAAGSVNTPLLVVAGGGGGGGGINNSSAGGAGGGFTGGSGQSGGNLGGGGGGSQTAGGSGGGGLFTGSSGSFLAGGDSDRGGFSDIGGGGGGGFYGGGGGGSSFRSASASAANGNILVTLVGQTQGGGGAGQTAATAAQFGSISITPFATPEPSTLPLLGMGLLTGAGMVGGIRRRQKHQHKAA